MGRSKSWLHSPWCLLRSAHCLREGREDGEAWVHEAARLFPSPSLVIHVETVHDRLAKARSCCFTEECVRGCQADSGFRVADCWAAAATFDSPRGGGVLRRAHREIFLQQALQLHDQVRVELS